MRHSPAVEFPVGRSVFALALHAAVGVLSLLVGTLWAVATQPPLWLAVGLLGVYLEFMRRVLLSLWRTPAALLQWDGVLWHCQSKERAAQALPRQAGWVHLVWDAQQRCLVQFTALKGATRWIWIERQHAPKQWRALRRALVQSQNDQPPAFAKGGRGG